MTDFSKNGTAPQGPEWDFLLQRGISQDIEAGSRGYRAAIAGKRLLVTGPGGWIGSALAEALALSGAREIVLLDTSETALYEVTQTLLETRTPARHISLLASVCDGDALDDAFARYRPEMVFHAAAFKHVPLMETNPFAAIANNALGTRTLAAVAEKHGCERIVMVSTDKAADPISLMGASKRIAELALLVPRAGAMRRTAVRLANVLGSSGSVVPLFLRQIARGGPVTVAHPNVRRYFMTLPETIESLLAAIQPGCPGGLLAPDPGAPIRILDLAKHLIARSPQTETPIVFTALRPGDKMEETLIATGETCSEDRQGSLRIIRSPMPEPDIFSDAISQLQQAVEQRNLEILIESVLRLVPEYQPSHLLREQLTATSAVHA
jgi:FlaA1/EpsC-like NDP-sugar epimerase